jgi:nicotinamide mononucleotide transporter
MLSAALYGFKGLYLTAILYAAYAIIAVFGYRKWRELMREQNAD